MTNSFQKDSKKVLEALFSKARMGLSDNERKESSIQEALEQLEALFNKHSEYQVTKQKLGDHEYTVLYDKDGNKYLMLEKFEIGNQPPKFDNDIADYKISNFWRYNPHV